MSPHRVLEASLAAFYPMHKLFIYNCRFSHELSTDEKVVIAGLNLLALKKIGDTFIWKNPSPAGITHCVPLKIHFANDSKQYTISEHKKYVQEIKDLKPTKIGN